MTSNERLQALRKERQIRTALRDAIEAPIRAVEALDPDQGQTDDDETDRPAALNQEAVR